MNTTIHNPNSAARRTRRAVKSRRGFASGLVLMMLVFLAGFVALGLNVSRLSQVQAQLRSVCQASALAGAAELMDEGFCAGPADQRDDIVAAREAARRTAERNFVDGRAVVLNPNFDNAPLGDIVVGSIEPLKAAGQPIALPYDVKQAQGLNTVRVTARMKMNTYNKVTLFCGALLGVLSTDAAASAQATLDRRVAGFRPEPGVKVPCVPLAAEYESWMKQALARCRSGINDRYTVNYATGEVTLGPDGIPEITLSTAARNNDAPSEDTAETENAEAADTAAEANSADDSTTDDSASNPPPAWCRPLALPSDEPKPDLWLSRCRDGLGKHDLAEFGGQLIVMPQGSTPAPVLTSPPQDLIYGLQAIVGTSRAWALAEAGADDVSCSIVGFAAGRIVAVRKPSDGSQTTQSENWEIIVQPTTLVCSQAVTTADMSPNPWIGKLELTQ